MLKKLKKVDLFGQKINLTFESNVMFKTSCGAICTLLMVTGVCIYFLQGFVNVWS